MTLDPRKEALAQQRAINLRRLEAHKIAIGLLIERKTRRSALSRAGREVRRWKRRKLCSKDYIVEWERLLAGPISDVVALLREDSVRGIRLRQNTPFGWALY